ncbi:GFA family protein [Ideonella sp.]|uniref:GFA family protein n=1 Tax=Ideonella sp. TaxID=1929293 RepID=UPI0035B38126
MRFHGSCHCGNLRFTLDWPDAPPRLPARVCGCSFCRKHGGVWTAHPGATLDVTVRDATAVRPYRFGTGTADFHLCTGCGVVPVVTSTIGGHTYAVASVNALDGVPDAALDRVGVDFDGEGTDDRLARRARGWIGQVRMSTLAGVPPDRAAAP